MSKFEEHQAAIGRILQEFHRGSSSDLSFARRATSTLLLEAFFQILNVSALDFYRNMEERDWHAILVEHRFSPAVMTFLLSNGVQPSPGVACSREHECIQSALQNLTGSLVRDAVINPEN